MALLSISLYVAQWIEHVPLFGNPVLQSSRADYYTFLTCELYDDMVWSEQPCSQALTCSCTLRVTEA